MRGADEAFFCGKTLTAMMKTLFCLILPALLCCIEARALKPRKDYPALPDNASFPGWKAISLETADHYKLAAWQLPPKGIDRHVNIIIAGGDAGNMSNWLPLAFALTSQGFGVLTFDYRSFGGSDAFPVDTAMLYYNEFGEDLKAVIRWSRSQHTGDRLALYAFSMGSVIAANVWAEMPADYFIAEGLVVSPAAVQQRLMALKGKLFGLPADAPFHRDKLRTLPERLLVFSGTNDPVCKPEDYIALAAQHPKMVIKTFSGGHGGGFSATMESEADGEYMQAIRQFVTNE